MEEEEGYLTGDSEPFISSVEAVVVCPVMESEDSDDLPPRDDRVGSTGVFKGEMFEIFLTDDLVLGAPVSDLYGRLYMFNFGDVGVEVEAPLVSE